MKMTTYESKADFVQDVHSKAADYGMSHEEADEIAEGLLEQRSLSDQRETQVVASVYESSLRGEAFVVEYGEEE